MGKQSQQNFNDVFSKRMALKQNQHRFYHNFIIDFKISILSNGK